MESPQWVNSRKQGSLMKMLPVLLGMATLVVLSLMYFSYIEDIDKREAADQVARKYLLKMETVGFLTCDDESALLGELREIGYENINLSGTTRKKISYGKEIMLVIKAEIKVTRYLTDDSEVQKNEQMEILSIIRKSTAKN